MEDHTEMHIGREIHRLISFPTRQTEGQIDTVQFKK